MKKLNKIPGLVTFILIFCMTINTISAFAYIDWGRAVYISYAGQVVDSITVNGVTVNSVYAPRNSIADYDSNSTYCCAAFVSRFYSQVYGVSLYNLWPGNTPGILSGGGYFYKTTTPKVGDIAANSGHWAIVKAVNGNSVTLIEQNCWNTAYNSAMVGRVLTSESSYWYWRWSGNDNYYLDVNGSLDGVEKDSIAGFGTVDVYVNGALVADDVSDYYIAHAPGTTYEIKDIKAVGCYEYKGEHSYSGTLNGPFGIALQFETAHDYKTTIIPPTCTEGEKAIKTCSKCGDSVTEDTSANPVWSEWSTTKPAVAESKIQTKLQYRYKKQEIKYSNESSMEGFTYVGRDWNEGVTSTVEYVENWPAGFDRNNALYVKYNNAVPASSVTADKKVEVGNTGTAGYVYWHWCSSSYNGTYPINRYISDCYMSWDNATSRAYDIFHAFFSSEYKGLTDKGAVEYYNDGACLQAYWWQAPVEVKKVNVTTYEMMNKFTRDTWTEWEDYSLNGRPDLDNSEFRNVYRYVISGAPATGHDWDRGVIIKQATETESGLKLLSCKDCDVTKEVSYNLSDYTCGDVNADGNINAADALLVLKYAARLDLSKDTFIEDAAYTNADDIINASDALNILKYAARILTKLPSE